MKDGQTFVYDVAAGEAFSDERRLGLKRWERMKIKSRYFLADALYEMSREALEKAT